MIPISKYIRNVLVGALCLFTIQIVFPDSLSAQPGPGEKEYCFCTTPRNNQAASGMTAGGAPSVVKITWRGMTFSHTPTAGQTAADIMTILRDMVAAANPGDVVGPVTIDAQPAGRAVFCVKGPQAGIRTVKARETDSNFRTTTFRRVYRASSPFLRGVAGALVSVKPQGGGVELEMLVLTENGEESYVTVEIPTAPGQSDLTFDMIEALNEAGFEADFGMIEFDDDGFESPAIFIDPGIHYRIEGLGMTTNDPGISETSIIGIDTDCSPFDTPPVDLQKSLNPVNGVIDRVQLKWYKDSPRVRYTDEDAAACDIKFWPKRNLDPETGNPIGPVISEPDTVCLEDVKKTYTDGSPRSIFKWPVKFRADDVNNSRRADPNIRYSWRVRCACQCGRAYESPWSDIKIFNTPDFDPTTGIYTPPEPIERMNDIKKTSDISLSLYPNPVDGTELYIQISSVRRTQGVTQIRILDMTGQEVYSNRMNSESLVHGSRIYLPSSITSGIYFIVAQDEITHIRKRFIVK